MGLVRFLRDRRQRRRMVAIAQRHYLGGESAYLDVKERILQEIRRGRLRLADLKEAQEAVSLWPRFEAETDEGFLDALAKCVPQRLSQGESDEGYDLRLREIFGHLRARVDGPPAPSISPREVEQARTLVATMRPSAPAPARVRQVADNRPPPAEEKEKEKPAAPAPPTPTPTKAERRAARRSLWARGVRSPSPADLLKEALRLRTEVPSHVA
jgi:hypothetical protein